MTVSSCLLGFGFSGSAFLTGLLGLVVYLRASLNQVLCLLCHRLCILSNKEQMSTDTMSAKVNKKPTGKLGRVLKIFYYSPSTVFSYILFSLILSWKWTCRFWHKRKIKFFLKFLILAGIIQEFWISPVRNKKRSMRIFSLNKILKLPSKYLNFSARIKINEQKCLIFPARNINLNLFFKIENKFEYFPVRIIIFSKELKFQKGFSQWELKFLAHILNFKNWLNTPSVKKVT